MQTLAEFIAIPKGYILSGWPTVYFVFTHTNIVKISVAPGEKLLKKFQVISLHLK